MKRLLFLFTPLMATMGMAQSYVPEYDNPEVKQQPVIAVKAYPFDLKDVRLLDGPFKQAMDADAAYLRAIDADRLLSEFRREGGRPSDRKDRLLRQ